MDIQINLERLKKDILDLAKIGQNPDGSISRPSLSAADMDAREWLKKRIKDAGLSLREDGAGNIFGRKEGQGKTVMSGSHIDTVVNGGKFDGAAGVLSALECLRCIREENLSHSKPLELASFTDEEGNLVGDFLGSRAFTGTLNRENLEKGITSFGSPLSEILGCTTFTIDSIMNAAAERPQIEAFVELHIEQGPVLEMEAKTVGIVNKILGKQDWLCSFAGHANHAGATPIELRQDAFLGLADFSLKTTHLVASQYEGCYVTTGKVYIHPGTFSTVPGRADFTLDFRGPDQKILDQLKQSILNLAGDIASTRGLQFSHKVIDETQPVSIAPRLVNMIEEECRLLDYSSMQMPSGPGHDGQILSSVADAAVIFIPCEDGISHAPEENIRWEDLEKGANLLLRILLKLAE